jgi:hypothetical protein
VDVRLLRKCNAGLKSRSRILAASELSFPVRGKHVLNTFMSAASLTAALPIFPDPAADLSRAPTAERTSTHAHGEASTYAPGGTPTQSLGNAAAQSGVGRVLSLLRKLIDYGQDLRRTVQERAAAATLFTVTVHFGTRDMALILARITRGLRLAAALEARLVSRPLRPDAGAVPARASARAMSDHPPADDAACASPEHAPVDGAPAVGAAAGHAPDEPAMRRPRRAGKRPKLPDLPTAEEIAAALRHRPATAVIADICRDLGIVPAHPLWREVMTVLCGHGGNVMKFFKDTMARLFSSLAAPFAPDSRRWPGLEPLPDVLGGTGPP